MMGHLDRRLLDAYAEQALNPNQRLQIAQHLTACPDCRKKLEVHQRLTRLAAHLPLEPVPEFLTLRVQLRLEQALAKRKTARFARQLSWLSAIFATLGMVLLASAWPRLAHLSTLVLALFDGSLLTGLWQALTNLSFENLPGLAQAGMDWQSQLAQDVDVVLLAGVIFLSLAAFSGLARMLLAAQSSFSMGSEE